jgi:hypothetical protein
MPRVRLLIALIVTGLLVPASAVAQRAATSTERAAILASAVHQGEISSTQATCQTVTISTVNSSYAVLRWPTRLSKTCSQVASHGVIIEVRKGAAWQLLAAGTSFQCPLKTAPGTVAQDLGVCP